MSHMFTFTIQAATYPELMTEAQNVLERLAAEATAVPALTTGTLPAGLVADLSALHGEYSQRLLRYICEGAVNGTTASSDEFKRLVGRLDEQGKKGQWIGGVTAGLNSVLRRHIGSGIGSTYDEGGAVQAWTIDVEVAASLLHIV